MKLVGITLLLFGGAIVIAALAMLHQPLQRDSFVAAGIALELLGLALVARDYAQAPRSIG